MTATRMLTATEPGIRLDHIDACFRTRLVQLTLSPANLGSMRWAVKDADQGSECDDCIKDLHAHEHGEMAHVNAICVNTCPLNEWQQKSTQRPQQLQTATTQETTITAHTIDDKGRVRSHTIHPHHRSLCITNHCCYQTSSAWLLSARASLPPIIERTTMRTQQGQPVVWPRARPR